MLVQDQQEKKGNSFKKWIWGFSSRCQGSHIPRVFLCPLEFLGRVHFQGPRGPLLPLIALLGAKGWFSGILFMAKKAKLMWLVASSFCEPPTLSQTLSQWLGNHPALGKGPATWVETEQNHPSQAKLSKAGLSLYWNPDSARRILAELQLGSALVNVTTVSQTALSLNKTQFDSRLCDINLKGEKRQHGSRGRASYYECSYWIHMLVCISDWIIQNSENELGRVWPPCL